jgi:phospholipase C
MLINRRHVLKGMAGAAALSGTGWFRANAAVTDGPASAAKGGTSVADSGPVAVPALTSVAGISPVEHVVVVMMENRSFDHFMGWMPGANGIGLGPGGEVVDEQRFSSFGYQDSKGKRHGIYHETQWNACGLADQDHGYVGGRIQWGRGRMDGFLLDPENTTFALSYYLAAQRAFTTPLAMNYSTCDNYFCSYLGPTWPNRFFQHAAQTDRQNDTTAPDGTQLPVQPAAMPSIWDQLNQPGGPSGRYYYSDLPFLALWGGKYIPISQPVTDFLSDAAAGTLPNVSIVDPRFEDEGSGTSGDDHPLSDIRAGDAFLSEIFHAVANGPLWSKTVFIINYDEWGGFFDHVAPPLVAPGNQTLDLSDVVRGPDGRITKVLAGFRVPCVIASPFSKGSPDKPRICSYAFDHASVLRFVEWNWKLKALTPRDASIPFSGASARQLTNLAHALDFAHPDVRVPYLPELAPFASTGCDLPGSPGGGPVAGGEPLSGQASAAPAKPAWAALKSSGLLDGWL